MLLETKFNVGDQRWMMRNNKPTLITITKIDLAIEQDNQIDIFYYINDDDYPRLFSEFCMLNKSFSTKQELINSL